MRTSVEAMSTRVSVSSWLRTFMGAAYSCPTPGMPVHR